MGFVDKGAEESKRETVYAKQSSYLAQLLSTLKRMNGFSYLRYINAMKFLHGLELDKAIEGESTTGVWTILGWSHNLSDTKLLEFYWIHRLGIS